MFLEEHPTKGNFVYEEPKEGVLVRSASFAHPISYYDTKMQKHQV